MPALTKPTTMLQPFANGGSKNTIPDQSSATPGRASMQTGFPPLTMTRIEEGGVPPSGLDFNGILNFISQHTAWVNAGGQYTFDAALSASMGGYPLGAVLQSNDGTASYVNVQAGNTTNFNTTPASIGVSWMPYGGAAVAASGATTVNSTGGTVTLTNAQAVRRTIVVTGTLTSNLNLIFPSSIQTWQVVNLTSGAFTLTCRASTGAGVAVATGVVDTITWDGTNMQYSAAESVTQAAGNNSRFNATTAFVATAIANALVNTNLTGTPTAPTPAANDNSTRLATTAFTQNAVANASVNSVPQYKEANFTAGVTGDYHINAKTGPITVMLPDPPTNQNILKFTDIAGNWANRPLTINPGTKTILGVPESLIDNLNGHIIEMWYDGTTWRLV